VSAFLPCSVGVVTSVHFGHLSSWIVASLRD
jgi:hypothetical protein